jgi:hypothetical protein
VDIHDGPIQQQYHNVIVVNMPTITRLCNVAHDFLRRFKNRFIPNLYQALVQITLTVLVNKFPERSFPTSLVNGRNDYNGVVVNAINAVSATVTASLQPF